MQYNGLAWATALAALMVLAIAGRILRNRSWFFGWLRGTCGLALLALALLVGAVAYDLHSYAPLPRQGQPLLTLSFQAEGTQRYRATVREGGRERSVILSGDLWQLDARVFDWKGLASLIGLQPGYRLELLAGRYLSTEQQAAAEPSRIALASSPYGIDLWRWLREGRHDLSLFDARGARVTFLPMADGAVYSVILGSSGLVVEPQTQAARAALLPR
ncbi:hypothetical protein KRX52_00140 [Pseudomonas sp. MAP12]|uniref:Cation/multidrug efflux pump n=1 Tax=Geopseudomonas aromaticivorans TaxID=2849492 RepID=A0ABS6MQZ8_9GAMM|nr:hypothetical protein [Pseudomonas aromaticivorans]MBV2131206.1 hypothetical protein [Pseudomonas aromaticivorans]